MKRLSTLLLLAAMAMPAIAQEKSINLESQRKKIAKSDEAIQNPKKKDNPKTWLERGNDFVDLYSENTSGLWQGMSKTELLLVIGKADAERQEQIGNVDHTVQVFPNKDLYFENEKLAFWKQTNVVDHELLFKAQQAYEKAAELDVQGKFSKKIKEGLSTLSDKMRVEGLNVYSLKDNKGAQRYFMAAAACKLHPAVNVVDTIMIYYSGVMSASEDVKDWDNALKHFNLCLQYQYYDNGNVYNQLALIYSVLKDTLAQEKALTDGFQKFPLNQEILIGLINFYLASSDDPAKIIDLLNKAQEGDPTNASLYFVEGTLYEKINRPEEALHMYKKSTEIDPKYYNGYYNMGTLHYNTAIGYITESTTIKDWRSPKIKELENLANEKYKLALAEFLKAYEIDPKEKAALEAIKNIYFRFREESPEMGKLYEEYKAKWDAIN